MGLISRVSSRTYNLQRNFLTANMKCKGDLKEYSIIGRKLPSAMEPNPKLFRQQIFAPDSVAAKSRFWKFLSYYQKINKKVGEVVECAEVHESHPGCVKNYGIWIRYDSRSTIENMYREYRDISLPLAVTQMYREMAGRHRARPGSIQVLRTKQVKSNEFDDHRTSRCTTQTSSSHSHDESCPRRRRPPEGSPPSDQTPSTKRRTQSSRFSFVATSTKSLLLLFSFLSSLCSINLFQSNKRSKVSPSSLTFLI